MVALSEDEWLSVFIGLLLDVPDIQHIVQGPQQKYGLVTSANKQSLCSFSKGTALGGLSIQGAPAEC